jgi:hypothetical protein
MPDTATSSLLHAMVWFLPMPLTVVGVGGGGGGATEVDGALGVVDEAVLDGRVVDGRDWLVDGSGSLLGAAV